MAWKMSLTIETVDPKRRDAMMEALFEALRETAEGTDTAVCKIEREGKTDRGKRKIVDTIEWMIAVEDPPVVSDFGLVEERPLERALRTLSGAEVALNGQNVRSA